MFDFGFSEMIIVGVVALVVLGPERLPVVARTAGEWIGKAQRFVAQVKSDIDRETELSELKKIQDEAKALANDVKSTVEKTAGEIETNVSSVAGEAQSAVKDAQSAVESAKADAAETVSTKTTGVSADDISSVYGWGDANTDSEIMTPASACLRGLLGGAGGSRKSFLNAITRDRRLMTSLPRLNDCVVNSVCAKPIWGAPQADAAHLLLVLKIFVPVFIVE